MNRGQIVFLGWALLVLGCGSRGDRSDPAGQTEGALLILLDGLLCPDCRIDFKEVALLGDSSDPNSVAPNAAALDCSVGRLSTGEFVLGAVVGGGEAIVYSPGGELTRDIGRHGEGPGEFGSWVKLVVGPRDTLFFLDDELARMSVFAPSGEFIRSFPIPAPVRSFALLPNGEIILHPTAVGPGGGPFHSLGKGGTEKRAFGEFTLSPNPFGGRVVSPAAPNGFWTADIWKYELKRWVSPDELALRVVRVVDWFPPNAEYLEGMPFSVPPPPVLLDIWDDGKGRIWTYTVVADDSWEPQIPLTPAYEWTRRTFDTVIEVIDLDHGQVIAMGRHDQKLGRVCGSPLVYRVLEAGDGDTRLQILEPSLILPTGSG